MRFRTGSGRRLTEERRSNEFRAPIRPQVDHILPPPCSIPDREREEAPVSAACAERVAAVLRSLGYGLALVPRDTKPKLN